MKRLPTIALALLAIALLLGARVNEHEGYEDLRFPLTRVKLGPANPPTFAAFVNGIYSFAFADEGVNVDQVFFSAQMPHDWALESSLDAHAHVSPEDATTCNYRICIEYIVGSAGASFDASSTTLCATFSSGEVAGAHDYVDIGDIDMSGHTLSAIVMCRLYRDSTNAADTCTGKDLWIHEIDFHYRHDSSGSASELSKN